MPAIQLFETLGLHLLPAEQLQKILPGVSPLKAIEKLPGVLYVTADPWGNNEQNLSLFVHGFSTQQLAFTMDNVPLGDQQYGNYNGLSVSRAVIWRVRVRLASRTTVRNVCQRPLTKRRTASVTSRLRGGWTASL